VEDCPLFHSLDYRALISYSRDWLEGGRAKKPGTLDTRKKTRPVGEKNNEGLRTRVVIGVTDTHSYRSLATKE